MIADITRFLFEEYQKQEKVLSLKVCVIEAGTGTGKTLALPVCSDPRCPISWEESYYFHRHHHTPGAVINKDLPAFRDNSGLDFDFALAKGRGRYLCLAWLETVMAFAEGDRKMGIFCRNTGCTGAPKNNSHKSLRKTDFFSRLPLTLGAVNSTIFGTAGTCSKGVVNS